MNLRLPSLLALSGLALFAAPAAFAADYDDLDSSEGGQEAKEPKERGMGRDAVVREIVKGTYAKAQVGGALYLGNFMGFVSPGTAIGLAVGQDFVDQEKKSMAWEVAFTQGINNGCHYELQADGTCGGAPGEAPPYIQGDIRTYTFSALVEYSVYPNRRFGIGGRVGGGVLLSPLMMDEEYYQSEVLDTWGIADPGYHNAPHPVVMGGPTFEYYTKLSHFSAGVDVDVVYSLGFDLGLNATGNLKYTF
jgi:hypothetical protein